MRDTLLGLRTQIDALLAALEPHSIQASLRLLELESDEIEVNGAKVKRGEAMRFKDAEIARVEVNRNGDEFTSENINELVASLALKPISEEHAEGKMSGIFTDARRTGDRALVDGLVYLKHASGDVVDALAQGKMFLSIEAGAERASCSKCGQTFDTSDAYCEHIVTLASRRKHGASRRFQGMYATGGGLTEKPAGRLSQISPNGIALIASQDIIGKEYSSEQRQALADKGEALADGSYPIADKEDLRNAVQAIGRASDPAKAKAHIIKRARALGCMDELPEDWVAAAEWDALKADLQSKVARAEQDALDLKALLEQANAARAQLTSEKEALSAEKEALQAGLQALETKHRDLAQTANAARLHAELVVAGHMTEDDWSAGRDAIMAMDERAIALLKRPRHSRITLVPAGSVSVESHAENTKPRIVW